jgi:hypothetical protein
MAEPKRFSHELLKDFPHDVFVHESEDPGMLHVSFEL